MPVAAERTPSQSERSSDLDQVRRPSPVLPIRPLAAEELSETTESARAGPEGTGPEVGRGGPGARRQMVARLQASHGNQHTQEVIQRLREERRETLAEASPQASESAQQEPPEPRALATAAPVVTGEPAAPAPATSAGAVKPTAAPVAARAAPSAAASERTAGAESAVGAFGTAQAPAVAPEEASETTGEEATAAVAGAVAEAPGGEAAPGEAAPVAPESDAGEAAAPEVATEPAPETTAAETPLEGEAEVPAEARSPASPAEDPAFQAVIARARATAYRQGHNNPAERKAAEAQAAARGPANEIQSQAAAAQVEKMGAQEPAPFDRAGFKAALLEKIAAITPRTLVEADEFKDQNKAASIKGEVVSQVASGKEAAQGAIQKTTAETPDTSAAQPKEVLPQPPTVAGAPPGNIGGGRAAPKPKTDAEVSLEAGSRSLDQELEDNEVTEGQLLESNEPDFEGAVAKKGEAQADAAEAPVAYRQDEAGMVAGAESGAAAGARMSVGGMYAVRDVQFQAIAGDQDTTRTADEQKRAEVSQKIEQIYQESKQNVETRLQELDDEVTRIFDTGAEQARLQFESYLDQRMRAYKRRRYSGIRGKLRWVKDKFVGLPDEVNVFYDEGRALYLRLMDAVIDDVATAVETGLNEATAMIAEGRTKVQEYVASLPTDLQEVGQQAANDIQSRFDSLKQTVEAKRDQLIDSLAQKYVNNLKAIDARIDEMKAANRGLVDAALDAIKAVIETIIRLKNMLLGVLARAAAVIGKIIKDPIGFVGNLVAGVVQGLRNFVGNIGTHLQQGLMGWLFGAMAEAGIQMPESFDLKGILSLILQILGLTYANIRARAVAIVGEPIVKALETGAEIFRILITEGPAGLWRYVQERIGDFKETVLGGIKDFVIERVIRAGITWIIGLMNPASAFVKACIAIYDIIMFFVNRASQIMSLVNAVLDSVAAIASGAIGAAAAAVENALARALPVAISFLASLLGLGGISQKIREIIMRIQAPINAAIDWIINQAVRVVRAIGGLFGGGRREQEEVEEDDPEKAARIEAGLAAIDQEEQGRLDQGVITMTDAEEAAARVQSQHPVFRSITVVDGGATWDYEYVASPVRRKSGERKKKMAKVTLTFNRKQKYDPGEYQRQLEGQASGLNAMTVARWESNRSAYLARQAATGSGRDPKSAHHQRVFREQERERRILEKQLKEGKSQAVAELEVDAFMRTQAALHDPDQIAGGEAGGVSQLGSRRINSSIGSQWRREVPRLHSRVSGLGVSQTEKENLMMNVELQMNTVP